ncbi:hypothetical protein JHK85_001091 [Glycine max]|nr:hypothetical protein JHK85_001091 [Glycine max]KAG5088447.1 hypothetical protein JHK86_001059 [Glycine max]
MAGEESMFHLEDECTWRWWIPNVIKGMDHYLGYPGYARIFNIGSDVSYLDANDEISTNLSTSYMEKGQENKHPHKKAKHDQSSTSQAQTEPSLSEHHYLDNYLVINLGSFILSEARNLIMDDKGKQPICGMAWHAQIGCQGGHSKCQQDLPMRAYTIAYWLL